MLGYKQVELQLDELSDEEIGKQLKKMRKRKGWSQDEMGDHMYLSRSNVSRLEAGLLSIRQSQFVRWVNKTDSQDIFLSIIFNVDPNVAIEILSNIANTGGTVGSILLSLGGMII
ncbi:helix-turn-helix domain-containing protein [Oceanobacillus sp. 1P07AA]|uniref:helix-turn-helix domain-containing protein n=1 Tax=Oceanobacillus sp. 1P07AA TaxID=3132293 RepID=UPI0039A5A527